jgi:hypothetical protein
MLQIKSWNLKKYWLMWELVSFVYNKTNGIAKANCSLWRCKHAKVSQFMILVFLVKVAIK